MTTQASEDRFQNLLADHKKILYKVCHLYCRNWNDHEDLAQEIAIQLWRSFDSFDDRCRFSTWMYRIALNVAICFYRRENTRARFVLSDSERLLSAVDETTKHPEEIQALYQFIDRLDALNRALVLLYLDGNSYLEIAEILGISETNVATKIGRLKKTMRQEALGKEWNMLDLDEMKQKWAEQDKKLDESLRLNRQVLSAVNRKGARSALQRMIAFLALEAAAWFAAIVTVGGFIYGQAGTPHFALAGIAVDLFAVGMLAATLGQIVMARRVEYSQPVAAIQKQLEGLRVLRIRIIQWALAVGAVVWAPFAIVVCRTLFRIADYSQAWLWANVLFGLSLIPLAIWLSKRFAERMGPSPLLRRLLRDIAGYNLTAAGESLAELSRFEHETQTE